MKKIDLWQLLPGILVTIILGSYSYQKSTSFLGDSQVIAYRDLILKEDIDIESFERFIAEEFTPTFEEFVPGVRALIMKGERGQKKDQYVLLLIFDSINTRNFYFPTPQHGETNMPEASLKLWRPGQIMLIERMDEFIEPLEGSIFTDFVIVR
ncbi:MAG: hypothetical protein KDC53_15125 [Saprospiraceae bacterium]|nr:hypothetical protein [Saprospiraceae bacterium]